ncbi:MAG: aspartate kinase [Cyanobacteria bacterium REEB67]|nr:aspartate kinase [Cyanobacteria bacterium REEB67]
MNKEIKKAATPHTVSVLKFGGTSVKNQARIQHVAEIVRDRLAEDPGKAEKKAHKILVVVSAMGDTTDYLLKLGAQCAKTPDKRELDSLLSTGEQISITLLAMTLKEMGLKARSFTAAQIGIFTESVHSKARIVDINNDNLNKALAENDILVVAGFQGITADGDITTLGRGGSDTTACALAAATDAVICDIYTDVDGIYTADPNIIKAAKLLNRVSYGEVIEMARLGAQVLHPRAVELARQYKVRMRVRNTFKPDHEGTIIDGGEDMEIYRSISGVAVDKDQACVTIMSVPDIPGIAGQIMQALADNNIVIDMIMQAFHQTAGLNNITFTVHSTDLDQTIKTLESIKGDLSASSVIADKDIAKVSLIGAGLAGQSGIAATVFKAFGGAGINIKMIATSEMKLTCVVSGKDADKAGKLMHSSFGEG